MNSDETSVQFFQNSSSGAVIPSMVERWCDNSEPIEGGVAEMYAVYGAVAPVRSKSVLKTDKVIARRHQKSSVGSPQVLG